MNTKIVVDLGDGRVKFGEASGRTPTCDNAEAGGIPLV
jgi:hypothetical protein